MPGRLAPAALHAERINAAADLAAAGVPAAEAARVLAGRFAVSARQARRYVDQAAAGGRGAAPGATGGGAGKLPAPHADWGRSVRRLLLSRVAAVSSWA